MRRGDALMDLSQIGILALGCPAIWLLGRREKWRRWGYILGLASQPFWIYTAIAHEQWGIAAVSLCYAYGWIQGIYNFWIKDAAGGKTDVAQKDR
jgi:hypothetical protein